MKKQYGGGPVDIYQFTDTYGVDLRTGEKTSEPVRTRVDRAVILPAKVERNLVSTISKISADKQFVYGGTYDRTRRLFLIDQRDAPNLELTPDDWLVYRRRKYKVATFDAFEWDSLWAIVAHELLGERPNLILGGFVTEPLALSESVGPLNITTDEPFELADSFSGLDIAQGSLNTTALLLEDGDALLLEDGTFLELE